LGKNVGFVLANPQQLRCRKSGHGRIAGNPSQRRKRRFQLPALALRAGIVPEDGGPQRFTAGIKENGTVHLARQADASDGGHVRRMAGCDGVERAKRRLPPVLWRLLAPSRLGASNVEWLRMAGTDGLRIVHQNGFDAGGAKIDTKIHLHPLRLSL
jgi:hypothetical protein